MRTGVAALPSSFLTISGNRLLLFPLFMDSGENAFVRKVRLFPTAPSRAVKRTRSAAFHNHRRP
jgi:hypothetical protein